jgi:hypothetical protein
MDYIKNFNGLYMRLLIEEDEFLGQLELNEFDIQWLFGLNEDKKFDKQTQKRVDQMIKLAKKRKKTLSFGPSFPEARTVVNLGGKADEETKDLLQVPKDISDFLSIKGYEVDDYTKGLAKNKENPNRKMRIGRMLKDASLKKKFDERLKGKVKKSDDLVVVFTYDPKDIALMSTGRGWTSCANLSDWVDNKGLAAGQIKNKIQYGGMVAYLTSKDDKNIESPAGRIAIRRLMDKDDGSFILLPEKACYGARSKEFTKTVKDVLIKNNKETADEEFGIFRDAEGGYSDTFDSDDPALSVKGKFVDFDKFVTQKKYEKVFLANIKRVGANMTGHQAYQVYDKVLKKEDNEAFRNFVMGGIEVPDGIMHRILNKSKYVKTFLPVIIENSDLPDKSKKTLAELITKGGFENPLIKAVKAKDYKTITQLTKLNHASKLYRKLGMMEKLIPLIIKISKTKDAKKMIKAVSKFFDVNQDGKSGVGFELVNEFIDKPKSLMGLVDAGMITKDDMRSYDHPDEWIYNALEWGEVDFLIWIHKFFDMEMSELISVISDSYEDLFSIRKEKSKLIKYIIDNTDQLDFLYGFDDYSLIWQIMMDHDERSAKKYLKIIFDKFENEIDFDELLEEYKESQGYDDEEEAEDDDIYKFIKRYTKKAKG